MIQEESTLTKIVKSLSLVYIARAAEDTEKEYPHGTPEFWESWKKRREFVDNLRSKLYRHGEEHWCCEGYFLIDCTPTLFKCLEEIHLAVLQDFGKKYDSSLGIGIFSETIGGRVRPVFIHRDFLLKEELKDIQIEISDYPTCFMDENDITGFLQTFPNVSYHRFPMSLEEIDRWEKERTQYSLRLRKNLDQRKTELAVLEDDGDLIFQYDGELGEEFEQCVKSWIHRIESDFQANRERIENLGGEWRVEFHKLFTTLDATYRFHPESCLRPIIDLLGTSGVFFYFKPMWIDKDDLEALTVTEKEPSYIPSSAPSCEREKLENDEKRLALVREMHFSFLSEMPGYDREDHNEDVPEYEQFLKNLYSRVHPDWPSGLSEEVFLTDCSEILSEFMECLSKPALVEVACEYDSWINLSIYSETVGARIQPVFIPRDFFYRSELDEIEIVLENCESYDLKRQSFKKCIETDPNVCVQLSSIPATEIEKWIDSKWQHTLCLTETAMNRNKNDKIRFHYSGEIIQPLDSCFKSWIPQIENDLNANREQIGKQGGTWQVECHIAFTTPNAICSFYAKSSFRPILDRLDAPGVFFYFEPIWLDTENQQAMRVTCKENLA